MRSIRSGPSVATSASTGVRKQGFPGGGVHAITQGADGYLWLGTERGLVRFDGTEFRLVTGPDAAPTGGRNVLGALVDAAGSLWLRPDRPALLRYRDLRFESVPFSTDPREVSGHGDGGGAEAAISVVYAQVSGLLVLGAPTASRACRSNRFRPRSSPVEMAETPDRTLVPGHARVRASSARGGTSRAARRRAARPQGQ